MRLECCGDCGGTPTSCASSKTPSSRTHDWANGSVSRQTNAPRRHVDGATRCAQVLRVQQRRSSKMARCVGPSGPSKCGAADSSAGAAGATCHRHCWWLQLFRDISVPLVRFFSPTSPFVYLRAAAPAADPGRIGKSFTMQWLRTKSQHERCTRSPTSPTTSSHGCSAATLTAATGTVSFRCAWVCQCKRENISTEKSSRF